MKEFRVITSVKIFTGMIGLRNEQAIPRRDCLLASDQQGIYQIIKPVEFKTGEIIMLEEVDKGISGNLAEIGATKTADEVVVVPEKVVVKKRAKPKKAK